MKLERSWALPWCTTPPRGPTEIGGTGARNNSLGVTWDNNTKKYGWLFFISEFSDFCWSPGMLANFGVMAQQNKHAEK